MTTKFTYFFMFLMLGFACSKSDLFNGYSRDSSGYYFKLISIGDGNESPRNDDVGAFLRP